MVRPSGRVPPQKRQPSGIVAFIREDSAAGAGAADAADEAGADVSGAEGADTGKVALIAGLWGAGAEAAGAIVGAVAGG
jgi:hypothetical protein